MDWTNPVVLNQTFKSNFLTQSTIRKEERSNTQKENYKQKRGREKN